MSYGDDQCVRCGCARVSGSDLCVGCLVKERDYLEKGVLTGKVVIETKRNRIQYLEKRLEIALNHGLKRDRENTKLLKYIRVLENEVWEVTTNAENR